MAWGTSLARVAGPVSVSFACGALCAAILLPSADDAPTGTAAATATPTTASSYKVGGGAASGAAGAAPVSPSPVVTAAGATSPPAAASATGPSAPAAAAESRGNGGATFRGVTATSIKIGIANLDSSALGPVCPRCDNGDAPTKTAEALVAKWRRDGLLPIHGRDITLVTRSYNVLSGEETRNACVQLAQQDRPFLVAGIALVGSLAECVSQEFGIASVSGLPAGDDALLARVPKAFQVFPTRDRVWRNYVDWLKVRGLLDGQVLGMYSPADSSTAQTQDSLTRSFRAGLQQAGYKLAVDMTYEGPQTDSVAVQRFRTAGVTVAFIMGALTEPQGFQATAERLGYRPRYPVAETGPETIDGVADVTYNTAAQDGNQALRVGFWDWAARRPATPRGNPQDAYCLKAYQELTKRTLDAYDDDSVIHSSQHICSALEVIRNALVLAGPDLTESSFIAAMHSLRGIPTADSLSVSFAPGKHAGSDVWATAQFRTSRWEPERDYWHTVSPWARFARA